MPVVAAGAFLLWSDSLSREFDDMPSDLGVLEDVLGPGALINVRFGNRFVLHPSDDGGMSLRHAELGYLLLGDWDFR